MATPQQYATLRNLYDNYWPKVKAACQQLFAAKDHNHGLSLLSGNGFMKIYGGDDYHAGVVGGKLSNFVISSHWGVSFTSSCSTELCANGPVTTVGINCRTGVVKAAQFYEYNKRVCVEGHKHTVGDITDFPSPATTSANGLMTAADKSKLDGIAAGATNNPIDTALSTTSANAVQNKAVTAAINGKAAASHNHDTAYLKLTGGKINGKLGLGDPSATYKDMYIKRRGPYLDIATVSDGFNIFVDDASWTFRHLSINSSLPSTGVAPTEWNFYAGNSSTWATLEAAAFTVHTTSDVRYKKNIEPLDAIPLIQALGAGREFDYKDGGHSYGFIAQEVQESPLADLVHEETDGRLTLNYNDPRLITLALTAIQQLNAKCLELEARLNAQESE